MRWTGKHSPWRIWPRRCSRSCLTRTRVRLTLGLSSVLPQLTERGARLAGRLAPACAADLPPDTSPGRRQGRFQQGDASRPEADACTAPGFLDTRLLLSGDLHDGLAPGCSGIAGTAQSVLFDEPLRVVAGDEVADGGTDPVDGLVDSAMHDLLLEGAEEALDDAIRLGLTDERIAGGHAPEADLVVEVFGEERTAMVVAQRHATGGTGIDVAEHFADGHTDGLDGGVAIAALGDVPA